MLIIVNRLCILYTDDKQRVSTQTYKHTKTLTFF